MRLVNSGGRCLGVIEAPFGPAGRYIVGGVTYAGGAGETYVGLNASGHQIWIRRYTGSGVPNHMSTAIDYNMLSMGRTHSGKLSWNIWLLRVYATLETLKLAPDADTRPSQKTRKSNGVCIVANYTVWCGVSAAGDVFLRKMEFATGNSIWYRTYGGARAEWAYDITLMDDGTMILLCETVSYGQGASDVYLINTDYDGIENWYDVYGGVSDEWLTSMVLLPNNVLLGVGLTKSYGHLDGAGVFMVL